MGVESFITTHLYFIAILNARLGNAGAAVQALQELRALGDLPALVVELRRAPDFDPIRRDPRFKQILQETA